MANARSQRRWRDRQRPLKRQLNVMARGHVHRRLDEFAAAYGLKGKAEAVTFACFVTEALMQRAEFSTDAQRMLDDFAAAYHRDRDLYVT